MRLREQRNSTLDMKFPYDVLVEENIAGLLYLENDIIVYANPAFAEVLNSSLPEVIGTSVLDWVEGTCYPFLREGLDYLFLGKKDEFSKNLGLKNCKNNFFSLHLRVVKRENGKTIMVGASRNSTKRVVQNEKLQQEELRYNALFENTIAGIMIYDYEKEEVLECNKAALNIMGYENSRELKGKSRYEIIPKECRYFPGFDLHKETDIHKKKIKKGISFYTRGTFLTKNGESILVRANITPTINNESNEGFIIFHDITNEVLNKRARKEIEKKHKDIFNNSNEAIVYIDIKTRSTTLCNDNALELLEVNSLEELRNKNIADSLTRESLNGMEGDEFVNYHISKALKNGRNELSFWIKKRDGELQRMNCLVVKSLSDLENPKVIIFLRDITYMYNAQEVLNEKNKELEKYIDSNMQLENFAYLASHDLQTPLRSIISFTQLLEKRLGNKLNYEEKEYLNFIVESGKNMKSLINGLLSYSRVNTEKINLSVINVNHLLYKTQSELNFDILNKSAIINIEMETEEIVADWNRMKQVFQNLIMNAIKFSKRGIPPYIEISGEDKKDHWQFSIKDDGIGIEKEYQEKIFLLFKRLNKISMYEGTGIGLAMVKKIVEQHSGRIWVESEYGEGSTFFFTIKKGINEID